MKRLVGYIRQSFQDAASSSPERQLEIIESWAKTHDTIITQVYKDIGGKRSEGDNVVTRKDFQKLLKDADARKFDLIIMASQERFGTLTTPGSSEGPVTTGEPGKAVPSDQPVNARNPRPDATGAERTGFLALSRTEEPTGPEPNQPEHPVYRG
jgi:hypothetical protein